MAHLGGADLLRSTLPHRSQLSDVPRADQQYFTGYLQPLMSIKMYLNLAAAHRFQALDMDMKE